MQVRARPYVARGGKAVSPGRLLEDRHGKEKGGNKEQPYTKYGWDTGHMEGLQNPGKQRRLYKTWK